MLETIVVVAIVMVVLILAGRSFYRTVTGKKEGPCCGCDPGKCGKNEDKGKDRLVRFS
ncbi:MAG: FeoB-associated Cys-rich membrane protein [Smithellaceae bacterium]|nr:FeoB-associated Cys-rich membrane protein [Smithellaceae bacterium]